jgi:NAD(P)-dependent dehydrogenase (short-subunit alcohol dehydrogenase family)
MDLQLAGKKVVVTGSTSGIGKAISECMLNEGAQVMINGRNGEKLEKVLEEFHLRFPNSSVDGFAGDVAETNDIVGFYDYVRNKLGG